MADWGATTGEAYTAVTGAGVTPGATANTKGSYVSYGTLTEPAQGFIFGFNWGQEMSGHTVMYDLAIGSAGSEIVVANSLAHNPGINTANARLGNSHVFIPCYLPAGEIRVRAQANTASHGICYGEVRPVYKAATVCAGAVVDTYGDNTTTTRGTPVAASTTADTFGAWTQITASCNRVKALTCAFLNGNSNLTVSQDGAVEIGIGPNSGSVTSLITIYGVSGNSGTGVFTPQNEGPFYVDIPPGSGIFARCKKQTGGASDRNIDIILYGVR